MPDSLLKSLYTKQRLVRRYLLTAPPNGQVWHKAFLWWVRAQGRSSHSPGGSKNASGPIRPQTPGNKPNPSEEPGRTAPWGSRKLTIRHECQTICWKASAFQLLTMRDLYKLSLTLMPNLARLICQRYLKKERKDILIRKGFLKIFHLLVFRKKQGN